MNNVVLRCFWPVFAPFALHIHIHSGEEGICHYQWETQTEPETEFDRKATTKTETKTETKTKTKRP